MLTQIIQLDWEISKRVFNSVFRKNVIYHNQILELCFSSCLQRIAAHLLDQCRRCGIREEDGFRLDIRFTHSDVASLVNTSRVTVNNTFTWLIRNGYLFKKGQYYLIPFAQTDRLRELAEGNEHA